MSRLAVACILALLYLAFGSTSASAHQCPRSDPTGADTPSRFQILSGRLIYHDGIRQWFELNLDQKKCGASSIQITVPEHQWTTLQTLRGCRVKTSGEIDFSLTGYFSLDLYQYASRVTPLGGCARQQPFADYSKVRPNKLVLTYTVEMLVDYRRGDHPIVFHVRTGKRELRPWQAYASYMLTGGYVLYGLCGHGFVVDRVYGTPSANPSHFDDPRTPADMAAFDPETAATAGNTNLRLGYTCIRHS